MGMSLYVCGTRGSFPAFGKDYEKYGHDTSCYCIRDGEYGIIIDCGSGLKRAVNILSGCKKVDILISHIHYDHIMGLFETKTFFDNLNADFYGRFDEWRDEANKGGAQNVLYPVDMLFRGTTHSVSMYKEYELSYGYSVTFLPSNHGNATSMMNIAFEDQRLCYTGDYEHENTTPIGKWVKDCNLLLFDGSYPGKDYPKFKGWGHSMWEDACKIAKENNVGQLVITHHAAQYDDAELEKQEQEAKLLNSRAVFAKQGDIYRL